MAAPINNSYWKFRSKHGRNFKYDPELLWNEFQDYCEWAENNPLYEEKPFAYQGEITYARLAKMRAITVTGFCVFADIDFVTWQHYKANEDFIKVTTRIEEIIKTYKFEGAAAELLNPNIIARDLGLSDKKEITGAVKGAPIFKFGNLNESESD